MFNPPSLKPLLKLRFSKKATVDKEFKVQSSKFIVWIKLIRLNGLKKLKGV